jgi:hypothetical protein
MTGIWKSRGRFFVRKLGAVVAGFEQERLNAHLHNTVHFGTSSSIMSTSPRLPSLLSTDLDAELFDVPRSMTGLQGFHLPRDALTDTVLATSRHPLYIYPMALSGLFYVLAFISSIKFAGFYVLQVESTECCVHRSLVKMHAPD